MFSYSGTFVNREIEVKSRSLLPIQNWSFPDRVSKADFIVDAGTLPREVGNQKLRSGDLIENALRQDILMFYFVGSNRLNIESLKNLFDAALNVL
jgi:hypothetical protein